MQVSTQMVRRRFLCLLTSAGSVIAGSIAGCGPSENKFEMTEDAKKTTRHSKIGDESKFKKTGKGTVGNRR